MSKQKLKLISKSRTKQKEKETVSNKPKLPLEIDLNKTYHPHESVIKTYTESGMERELKGIIMEEPSVRNEARVFQLANANRPPKPIKHKIVSIYRKRQSGKEWVFFHEHLSTQDPLGNPVDHTRTLGRYDYANIIVQSVLAIENGVPVNTPGNPSIESTETKYLWEFEKIKPQLIKWYDEGIIDQEKCQFTAWVGLKRYTVSDWDSFINYSLDDLVSLSRFGAIIKPEQIAAIMEQRGKEKAAQMMLNRID